MARIRTIKPEFWDDENLANISRDARLFFISMWSHADDAGLCKGNAAYLRSKAFPYDVDMSIDKIKELIEELMRINSIIKFDLEGEQYIFIRTFSTHQKIDKPSLKGAISLDKIRRVLSLSEAPRNFYEYSASIRRIVGAVYGYGKGKEEDKEMEEEEGNKPEGFSSASATYDEVDKSDKGAIIRFIKDHRPNEIFPYTHLWNLFADQYKYKKVKRITRERIETFKARLQEPEFDFIDILTKVSKSTWISKVKWFDFDWIIEKPKNYLGIIEGKYDQDFKEEVIISEPRKTIQDIREEKDRIIRESA